MMDFTAVATEITDELLGPGDARHEATVNKIVAALASAKEEGMSAGAREARKQIANGAAKKVEKSAPKKLGRRR